MTMVGYSIPEADIYTKEYRSAHPYWLGAIAVKDITAPLMTFDRQSIFFFLEI